MILSIIVAAAENNVIGRDNGLIWKLSADLKHFKALTTGHTIIMGRKTFESIGRPLPNRRNVIISRNPAYRAEGCEVVESIDDALKLVEDENESFIVGGGTIYKALWDRAERIYLTRVHTRAEGDTFIPELETGRWELLGLENFPADDRNEFAYSFITYQRVQG